MTDVDYTRLFPRLARQYGEDIAQEALVRCWRVSHSIHNLAAYASRVARNLKLAHARGPYNRLMVVQAHIPEVPTNPAQFAYVEIGELVRKLPPLVWDALGYPLPGQTPGARRLQRFRYRKKLLENPLI